MMLHLYDTQTRQKRPFKPLDPRHVGMYVCGVTPYDDSHIGHARAYTVADVLFRLLRHMYGESHVSYVRNFTDIDDKIITRAAERGETPEAISTRYIASFYEDMDALNILRPTAEPKVSDTKVLQGIMEHIDALIEKGFAYVVPSGDVMYQTFKFPNFGELAGRRPNVIKDEISSILRGLTEEEQRIIIERFGIGGGEGASIIEVANKLGIDKKSVREVEASALRRLRHPSSLRIVDNEKRSPNDFVLWKANAKSSAKLEQAFEPEAYGAKHFNAPGRPGWHIECSVMSKQNLGPMFDIHGGGEDLQFPHHCCEIAQSEPLLPMGEHMANYWVHNGFITVNGTKMSKSLGNFTTIKDALQKYSPEAIRLWLLQTHYRKPVDYSAEALQAAQKRLVGYKNLPAPSQTLPQAFVEALADDLNTPKALAALDASSPAEKAACLAFLGLHIKAEEDNLPPQAESLLAARHQARTTKNWAESDRLRDELKAMGILVEDKPDGTTTWRKA